jgi:hypothetical protein
MAKSGLFLAVALLGAPPAFAQQVTHLFPPITGLWIMPGTHNGDRQPYGASSPDANWVVGQWNIPDNLPAFSGNTTSNQYAAVTLGQDNSFTLSQDASTLPCNRLYGSGRNLVDEFDILVQPVPTGFLSMLSTPQARPRIPLDQLSNVTISGTVKVTQMQEADASCRATQGIVGIGVVATDPDTHQTFFYQVSFTVYKDLGDGFAVNQAPSNWFFQGSNIQNGDAHQFGYGDRAWNSYSMAPLAAGQSESFSLNVLPVIKQLMAQQAGNGMDQNLDDWAVTGAYYGESAFGHVQVGSAWSHVDMTEY